MWTVGRRGHRTIGLSVDGRVLTNNVFSLSTGQTLLLDIFLTIIRDADLSEAQFQSLDEIRGVAIIDEVDLHLHSDFQYSLLPKLIGLFPRIQFILTSHSPLFVLGMNQEFGEAGFEIVELPSGESIGVESFSEFEAAYFYFRESSKFKGEVKRHIEETHKPILFVEGELDIEYIQTAARLLGRSETLEGFRLLDAKGYGGLDKVWKHFDSRLAEAVTQSGLLLYDCDVARDDSQKGRISRRVLPTLDRRIGKGIENLFSDALIEHASRENPSLLDMTTITRTVRGEPMNSEETREINSAEKRNLANWILRRDEVADFGGFGLVFRILDEFLAGLAPEC